MPARQRTTVLLVCALLVVVTLAYANHFRNTFHFDDAHTIVDNPYIRQLGYLPLIFSDSRAFSVLPSNRSYRPLVTASLALDYRLGHGLNPLYFQASTFFWFLVQIVLMFALFLKVCNGDRWIALFAAALYGLHPAIAETVNYVIQRGDVYSTLGVVAGMAAYARFPNGRRFGWYLIPVALGLLSKPPALIFPAILFVYIWLIEMERPTRALVRCAPALAVIGVFGYVVSAMTPATYVSGAGSAFGYRITQPLVALRYFTTFFMPIHLSADTDHVALENIWSLDAWIGITFLAAVIVAAVWCSKRREWHPAAFGLWWFLLALVPTSIFPLAEVENDHRMYLPFVGLSLAVCWSLATWFRKHSTVLAALSLVVLSSCAWGVRQRNQVWRTDESLWYDVSVKSPHNGRGLMNYGLTQMEKGRYVEALDYFQRAIAYTPAYSVLEINLGIATAALNQDEVAEQHFLKAITLSSGSAESRYFYARWLKGRNRWPEAIAQLQLAVVANPDHLASRDLLMEINAVHPTAKTAEDYLNLSLSYQRVGKFQEGLDAANEALKIRPDYAEAYNNVAAAYEGLKMWDQAIAAAQQALKIRPDFQLARNNLAWSEDQKKKAHEGK